MTRPAHNTDHDAPLSSRAQYRQEIADFPILTLEQEQALAARIQAGDRAASEALLESCLRYVFFLASKYAPLLGVECMELVSLGNLAVVECLDRALSKPCPVRYLAACAKGAMFRYASREADLIHRPHEGVPSLPVESLDVPVHGESDGETLAQSIPERVAPPAGEADYSALDLALDALPETYRSALLHHYGLRGHAAESFVEVDRRCGFSYAATHTNVRRAVHALRSLLTYEARCLRLASERALAVRQARTQHSTRPTVPVRERLDQAFATLQATGQPITGVELRVLAHVGANRVYRYLREKRAGAVPQQGGASCS